MKIQELTERYGKHIFPLVWAIQGKGMFKIAKNFEHLQFDSYFPNTEEAWRAFLQELYAGEHDNFPTDYDLERKPRNYTDKVVKELKQVITTCEKKKINYDVMLTFFDIQARERKTVNLSLSE